MYRVWFSSVDGVVLCLDISTGVRNCSIVNLIKHTTSYLFSNMFRIIIFSKHMNLIWCVRIPHHFYMWNKAKEYIQLMILFFQLFEKSTVFQSKQIVYIFHSLILRVWSQFLKWPNLTNLPGYRNCKFRRHLIIRQEICSNSSWLIFIFYIMSHF